MKLLDAIMVRSKKNHNLGTRHERKLKKYSKGFNEMFIFFLKSYRNGFLTFCGSEINVNFDIKQFNGRECFRRYDDGYFKNKPIITKHNNIVKGVITGKKSWGLSVKQWCDGINEWSFTKDEILDIFIEKGIEIPKPLIKEFNNRLEFLRQKRIEEEINRLKI